MANEKSKRANEVQDAQKKKQDAANARRTGKYSDRILYSPLDNPKTYEKVTRPGMVPKRA